MDQELILLDKDGLVIEILRSADGVPSAMQARGINNNQTIFVKAAHGIYQLDIDELNWHKNKLNEADIIWSTPSKIDKELYHQIEKHYRGKGLTLEKVIQDIHSGRIMGYWGVLFVDLIGVFLLVLIITGCYMWFKRF